MTDCYDCKKKNDCGCDCPDFCNAIQACAALHRGSRDDIPAEGVRRYLFKYHFQLQNCLSRDVRIDNVKFSLCDRIIHVSSSGEETPVVLVGENLCDTPIVPNRPLFKLLSIASTCGEMSINSDGFTGRIGCNDNDDDDVGDDDLFTTCFLLPPGECCIDVLFAVDVLHTHDCEIILDPPCLTVKGSVFVQNKYCRFKRTLIAPSDCPLQLTRETF